MIELLHLRTLLIPGLVLIVACTTSCSSSVLGWHVRTYASPSSPPFDYRVLEREPVAIFGALGLIPIEGNEVGVENFLAEIMTKPAPVDARDRLHWVNKSNSRSEFDLLTQWRRSRASTGAGLWMTMRRCMMPRSPVTSWLGSRCKNLELPSAHATSSNRD